MSEPVEDSAHTADIRRKIIGLGSSSIHKSYYPELQQRLADLERFRTLLDHSPDYILTVDLPSGRVRDVNASLRRVLGLSMEQVRASNIDQLLPGLDLANLSALTPGYDNELTGIRRFNVSLQDRIGAEVPLEISVTPLELDGERYAVVIGREIGERLRYERMIRSQVERFKALHRIDRTITSNLGLVDKLEIILNVASTILVVDGFSILRFTADNHELRTLVTRPGCFTGSDHPVSSADIETWRQQCLLSVRLVESVDQAYSVCNFIYRVYLAAPLMTLGEVRGLLEIYGCSQNGYNAEQRDFLESLAVQISIAIDNAERLDEINRIHAQLEANYQELEATYDATLQGWAHALELRERETAGHSDRVVSLTLQLARAVGISGEALTHIRRGAQLHDIGKIGIADAILLKPGPLNGEEWEIMRRHPVYSYNLLVNIPFLRPALDIPRYHHERWNGGGYPEGLNGEQIPVAARLFAIVDVWDALLSDRPYQKAWERERVVTYIQSQAGQAFDPHLVDIFLELVGRT